MMQVFGVKKLSGTLLISGVLTALAAYVLHDISFYRHHYLSGWVLAFLVVLQMHYYLQKKYQWAKNLLKVQWLTFHAEIGFVALLLLLIHTGWQFPDGTVGVLMFWAFIGASLTGFLGYKIKRQYQDTLMRGAGKEIDYEEIQPAMRHLQSKADALMLQCAVVGNGSMLVSYYSENLSGRFGTPDNMLAQLGGNSKAWLHHFGKVEKLMPYLNQAETVAARELIRFLRKKNNLDYQYAHQSALRVWLFIHVPFACALVILTLLHIVLVHAFSGGA